MAALWNNKTEMKFFTETLKTFSAPEQLFYKLSPFYKKYNIKDKALLVIQLLDDNKFRLIPEKNFYKKNKYFT